MRPIGVAREKWALRILLLVVLALIVALIPAPGADAVTTTTGAAPREGALQPVGYDYDNHPQHVDPTVELSIASTSGKGGDIRCPLHSYDAAPNFERTSVRQAARFFAPQTPGGDGCDPCAVPQGTIGPFGSLPSSSQCHRHHIVQHAAVQDVPGTAGVGRRRSC